MKKHFRLGIRAAGTVMGVAAIALSPVLVSAASDSENTTINAVVAEVITLTTTGTVQINITPVSGGSQSSASDTVTVNTNNGSGYNLSIKDSDATLTLSNGTDTIAASTNTFAAGAALANNTWGWAVPSGTTGIGANNFDASYSPALDNVTSSTSTWTGITATDQEFKDTATNAIGDTTTVWFSAKADTSLSDGTYTGAVTYTAVTNP